MTVTEDGAVFVAQLVGRVQKFVVAADEWRPGPGRRESGLGGEPRMVIDRVNRAPAQPFLRFGAPDTRQVDSVAVPSRRSGSGGLRREVPGASRMDPDGTVQQ